MSKLKQHSDTALISQVKRQRDNIMITFTPAGSHLIKAPTIIKLLAQTKFKATLGEQDHQLTVRLVIQPKMTTADWLNQLFKLVTGLSNAISETNTKTVKE